MLDAGRGGGSDCVNGFDQEPERSDRRQYTLKGIEAETIQLMREAAKKEGMKIGSWVSIRMKEVAERALASDGGIAYLEKVAAESRVMNSSQNQATPSAATDARLSLIEQELRELAVGQRAIMANLLTR